MNERLAQHETSTSCLWDDSSGLPTLDDDGTNTYLSADSLQAAIDSSGATSYVLDDALPCFGPWPNR